MVVKDIYQMFKQKPGSETMANVESLEALASVLKNYEIKNVLELGAGIGTMTYTILVNSIAQVDTYEPNEFCLGELDKNLSEFKGRYNIIKNYLMLPPKRSYDLIIVDGGAGERGNGSAPRTILSFLDWIDSVKIIYVQGKRYAQRSFIRKALRDKYIYKLIKNPDGVIFEIKRSNSRLAKWSCYVYWSFKEKNRK